MGGGPAGSARTETRFPCTRLFRSDQRADPPPAPFHRHARPAGGIALVLFRITEQMALVVVLQAAVGSCEQQPVEHTIADAQLHAAADRGIQHARLFAQRSDEHTSELQSLMRTSYPALCLNTN